MSASDRHVVKQYLLDSDLELKSYQSEVNRLKARIMVLQHKGKILKEKRAKYTSLLSPIRRMPPEVLVEIFERVCSEETIRVSRSPAIVVLANVCGRWRQIVLSTSRLWSTIRLRLNNRWFPSGGGKLKRLEYLVNLFLERSRRKSLSLTLQTVDGPSQQISDEQLDQALSAIKGLFHNSDRWRALCCTHTLLQRPALQKIRNRVPALERLEIVSEFGDQTDPLFDTCPSLTSLNITADNWSEHDFPFPFYQLNSLSICNSWTLPTINILRSCTNLARLELHSTGGNLDNLEAEEHVILPTVQHLIVVAQEHDDATTIFQVATLGSLKTLEIGRTALDNWRDLDFDVITDFLIRSSCSITSLSLDNLPISDAAVTVLLRLMPTLTSLTIKESPLRKNGKNTILTSSFFKLFDTEPVGEESFLPSLQELTLVMHHSLKTQQNLLDVAASRAPNERDTTTVAPLRSLTVTIMSKAKVDMVAFSGPLQYFRDAGLRVDISFKELSQPAPSNAS
ncbi:hypothetical protein PQX77_010123 [Marasmius sp. AFHP31]|nr:hypothetical protein PQX77_010123 [Marasmius sp. AFHP31]